MMSGDTKQLLDAAVSKYAEHEHVWTPHDQRGRWVVLEVGIGRHLKDASVDARRYADAVSERRARRFSSLSRARAFAHQVGGVVRHWRRRPPSSGIPGIRRVWVRLSTWGWANRHAGMWLPLARLARCRKEDV